MDAPKAEETKTNTEKCPSCGDNLVFDPTSGKLKCPSCGTEKEIFVYRGEEQNFDNLFAVKGTWQDEAHVYKCLNCNGEEILSKREIAHVCAFCGSPSVVEEEELNTLRPNALLPFLLDKKGAANAAAVWAKKKFFAPKDFKTSLRAEALNGIYLPAFTFDAHTYSTYQGRLGEYYYTTVRHKDGSTTRIQHTRYFSVSGRHEDLFDDVAVNATDAVPPKIMNSLMYYDYHDALEYQDDFLYGFSALLYSKDGATCWQEAKGIIDSNIRQNILSRHSHDTVDYLSVDTVYRDLTYKYILLPMYSGHYNYRQKNYSFFVNGRSGKVKGKSPVSPWRVTLVSVLSAIAAAGIITLAVTFL